MVLQEGVLFDATLLMWVLKRTCPAAHKHLLHHGVEPLMFATDWLMCLFTRHLPFNMLLRVWDLFFCYGLCKTGAFRWLNIIFVRTEQFYCKNSFKMCGQSSGDMFIKQCVPALKKK